MIEDACIEAVTGPLSEEAQDLLAMVTLLRSALGDVRGKIRVVDVQVLAGIGRPSYYRMSLVARALRHLGWKRARYRFHGTVAYGYARGTRLQREDILEIERGAEGQFVLRPGQAGPSDSGIVTVQAPLAKNVLTSQE